MTFTKARTFMFMFVYETGVQLGFSDRGCKLLVNCISTYVKPPFSWFQIKSFQKTAGANSPPAPALIVPLHDTEPPLH